VSDKRHIPKKGHNPIFVMRCHRREGALPIESWKAFPPTQCKAPPSHALTLQALWLPKAQRKRRRKVFTMQFTRNRYFMAGVLLFMLGVQFRFVQSFVLNEPTTRTLAKITKQTPVASSSPSMTSFLMQVHPSPKKRVEPPRWLGLAMVAVGAVVALHAMAMPKQ
jgi:hypothetical protein